MGEVAYAPSCRRRRSRRCLGRVLKKMLCPRNYASPWFAASCCLDGSLPVFQPIWFQITFEVPPTPEGVASTHTCALPTWNAGTSLGRNCRTTHPPQSSQYGNVRPHLAGDVRASFRTSAVDKKDHVQPLVLLFSHDGGS